MKHKAKTENETIIDSPKNVLDLLRIWLLKQAGHTELYVPSDYINMEESS
jgi:hypothetical protein